MPRSLAAKIADWGFMVQDVRDIGLRGHPDTEVMQAAIALDSIIITGDRALNLQPSHFELHRCPSLH
jgi:predicted nuclease of predicted toxin-antitoxin system